MPRYKILDGSPAGVRIETKDDIRKRLQRSTDRADAVIMAWLYGDTSLRKRPSLRVNGQQVARTGYAQAKSFAQTGGRRGGTVRR